MTRLEEMYRLRIFFANEIAREEAALPSHGDVDSGSVLDRMAALYNVTVEAILSDSRDTRATKARHGTCWLLRAHGLSTTKIGAAIGRDHTTVMYACRKIDSDPAVRALLWPLLTKVA